LLRKVGKKKKVRRKEETREDGESEEPTDGWNQIETGTPDHAEPRSGNLACPLFSSRLVSSLKMDSPLWMLEMSL